MARSTFAFSASFGTFEDVLTSLASLRKYGRAGSITFYGFFNDLKMALGQDTSVLDDMIEPVNQRGLSDLVEELFPDSDANSLRTDTLDNFFRDAGGIIDSPGRFTGGGASTPERGRGGQATPPTPAQENATAIADAMRPLIQEFNRTMAETFANAAASGGTERSLISVSNLHVPTELARGGATCKPRSSADIECWQWEDGCRLLPCAPARLLAAL